MPFFTMLESRLEVKKMRKLNPTYAGSLTDDDARERFENRAMKDGKREGRLYAYRRMVADGELTIEEAADRLDISVKEYENLVKAQKTQSEESMQNSFNRRCLSPFENYYYIRYFLFFVEGFEIGFNQIYPESYFGEEIRFFVWKLLLDDGYLTKRDIFDHYQMSLSPKAFDRYLRRIQ